MDSSVTVRCANKNNSMPNVESVTKELADVAPVKGSNNISNRPHLDLVFLTQQVVDLLDKPNQWLGGGDVGYAPRDRI